MRKVIASITTSVDGSITGPDDRRGLRPGQGRRSPASNPCLRLAPHSSTQSMSCTGHQVAPEEWSGEAERWRVLCRTSPGEGRHHCSGSFIKMLTKEGVDTVHSTPWTSYSVVSASDLAGLGRFSKEGLIFRVGARFESHLGHVFPCQGPFWASECVYPPRPMWLGPVSSPRYMQLWLAFLWPVPSFLSATFSPCYSFIVGTGGGNMTCFGPGEWGRGGLLSVSWS
jgi:hypothetical protein